MRNGAVGSALPSPVAVAVGAKPRHHHEADVRTSAHTRRSGHRHPHVDPQRRAAGVERRETKPQPHHARVELFRVRRDGVATKRERPEQRSLNRPRVRETSKIDVALERNIIGKSGSWYTYGEQRIGQGRENAKAFLEEHSDVSAEIEGKIREALKAVNSTNGAAKTVGALAGDD